MKKKRGLLIALLFFLVLVALNNCATPLDSYGRIYVLNNTALNFRVRIEHEKTFYSSGAQYNKKDVVREATITPGNNKRFTLVWSRSFDNDTVDGANIRVIVMQLENRDNILFEQVIKLKLHQSKTIEPVDIQ